MYVEKKDTLSPETLDCPLFPITNSIPSEHKATYSRWVTSHLVLPTRILVYTRLSYLLPVLGQLVTPRVFPVVKYPV